MLYVLDLDDTLCLEADFVRSGFFAVDRWLAKHTPVKGFFEGAMRLFTDGARGNIFDSILDEAGCHSPELIAQLLFVYRNHLPEIHLLPDAAEFLRNHKKDELALITDGYTETQWNKINALNLKEVIGTIVVTNEWGREFWKPHPKAYREVSKGHDPGSCVYIGDNPEKDFMAPAELGWAPSVRIRREHSLHEKKETPSGCLEVRSFYELTAHFQ